MGGNRAHRRCSFFFSPKRVSKAAGRLASMLSSEGKAALLSFIFSSRSASRSRRCSPLAPSSLGRSGDDVDALPRLPSLRSASSGKVVIGLQLQASWRLCSRKGGRRKVGSARLLRHQGWQSELRGSFPLRRSMHGLTRLGSRLRSASFASFRVCSSRHTVTWSSRYFVCTKSSVYSHGTSSL